MTTQGRNPALPVWLVRHLAQALAGGRGHAWLVAGASGLGQFEWAHAAAKAWLCEVHDGRQPACGHCASCHLVDARTHPDLLVRIPEALAQALGWQADEEEGSSRSRTKPSAEIRAEPMRQAVAFAQTTSARGRGKVVLVYPAERLNPVSAHALLKTLEEPPGIARFLLASEHADRLMPTLRSRCQTHVLPWPQTSQAVQWLVEQGGVEEPDVMLQAAGGKPMAALRLVAAGLKAAQWRTFPDAVARGDVAALQGWSSSGLLAGLMALCTDLTRLRLGLDTRHFAAATLPAPPALPRLTAWHRELIAHARHIDHPWQAALLTEALMGQARQTLAATDPPAAPAGARTSNARRPVAGAARA